MVGILMTLLFLLVVVVIAITIVNYLELDAPLRKVVILIIGIMALIVLFLILTGAMSPLVFHSPRVTIR